MSLEITRLKGKIESIINPTTKIDLLLQLADLQQTKNVEGILKTLEDAKKIAFKNNLNSLLPNIYEIIGEHYLNQEAFENAVQNFQKALEYTRPTDPKWITLSRAIVRTIVKMGDFQKVKIVTNEFLRLAQKHNLKEYEIFLHIGVSVAYHRLQDYSKVDFHTTAAFEIGEKLEQTITVKRELARNSELVGRLAVVRGDFEKARIYYQKAVDLAKQVPDNAYTVFAILNNFTNLYFEQGDFVKAFEKLNQAQDYIPTEKKEYYLAFIYSSIGDIYDRAGDYRQALSYNFQALKWMRQYAPKYYVVSKLSSIGQMLLKNKQYEEGLNYLLEAKEMGDALNYTEYHNDIFKSLGNYYLMDNQYEKALTYFEATLEKVASLDNKSLMVQTLNLIGKTYTYQMNYERAIDYHKEALIIAESIHSTYFQGVTLNFIGQNLFKNRAWELAIQYVKKALQHNVKGNYKAEIEMSYAILYQIYELQKDFEQALLYFKLYKQFSEERQKSLNEEQIAQLELNIQLQKREQEIKLLRQKQVLLQQANDNLNNFASMASHDLKEPLRMIHSFGRLLVRHNKHQLDDRGIEYLSFITDGAKRMSNLINDLLALVRAEKLDKPIVAIDLNEVLAMVKTNLSVQIKTANATLNFDKLPTIQAHFSPILQVFQNLISNSIKFHRAGVPPVIHIKATTLKTSHQISICDNGIGIKAEAIPKIFGIFYRLNNREQYEGTGIGLAICKKIVESYHGTIEVESTVGKGSVFRIVLPCS